MRVSGSDTLEDLFKVATAQFARGATGQVSVAEAYKGTGAGFKDMCESRADIVAASSKFSGDAVARCRDGNAAAFVEVPIAYDAVVVVAHPMRAALGEITLEELKKIFSPENAGKITRWSQVRAGLPDTPLSVVSPDPKSGTNAFFGEKVHGLKGLVRPDAKVTDSHVEILRQVAADPNAIGFVSLGVFNESKAAVWKVPVNFGKGPVVASNSTVLNDSYGTFSRLLYPC